MLLSKVNTIVEKLGHVLLFVVLVVCSLSIDCIARDESSWSFASRIEEQVKVSYLATLLEEDITSKPPNVIHLRPLQDNYSANDLKARYPEVLINKISSTCSIALLLGDELKEIARGAVSLHALKVYEKDLSFEALAKIREYTSTGALNGRVVSIDRVKLKSVEGQTPKLPLHYRYKIEYQIPDTASGKNIDIAEEVMIVQSIAGITFEVIYRDVLKSFKERSAIREAIFQSVDLTAQVVDTRREAHKELEAEKVNWMNTVINLVIIAICVAFIYIRMKKNKQNRY